MDISNITYRVSSNQILCAFINMTIKSFLLFLLLVAPALGNAEPKKHNEFFEHDYAGSVMDPKSNKKPRKRASSEDNLGITPEASSTPAIKATFSAPSENEPATPSPTPDENELKDRMEAMPVKSIGALLNAKPSEKLFNDMRQLIDISLKYNYPVGEVTIIGSVPRSKTDMEIMGVSVRGGKLQALTKLPHKYRQVTRSPTWILETGSGEILLEGFANPQKFLNSRGEFVPNILERATSSDEPDVASVKGAKPLTMP